MFFVLVSGCDRIPIENLQMESPESIFVMVLAAFGEYKAENYYFCNVHFETSTQKQVNIGCLVQSCGS